MQLTLERGVLLKSLAHVQSVVERRTTIPILSNVLLDAEDGQLGLTSTDMDLTVAESIPASVSRPGATTAPVHMFHDIVRKLPEGADVAIEPSDQDGRILLRCGDGRFTLACLPAEDFPGVNEVESAQNFAISAQNLRRLIDKTRFAISLEETRYYLNGIYLHAVSAPSPLLRSVATDGHRLARVDVPLPEGAADIPGVILPRKAVSEIRKLIDEVDDDINFSLSETMARLTFGTITITTKLIDGNFPDYGRVIPAANDKIMECDSKQFIDVVDRVSTVATDRTHSIKLAISAGELEVSARSLESGSASEKLLVHYNSSALQIGFNARYLLEMAHNFDGERISLAMTDAASPSILRDTDDANALFVLMPMRV